MKKTEKKALIVATVVGFITSFETNDIKLLQEMGYRVSCATNMSDIVHPDRVNSLKDNEVKFFDVSFDRCPMSKQNVQAYKELRKIMRDEQFDLVHCHTPVGGVLGRMAAHKEHVSHVIYTAHGFHFFDGAPNKNWVLYYPVEKFLSRWTDVLITINKEDYKRAKEKFHAKETVYIPGVGVNVKKFAVCKVDRETKRVDLGVSDDDFLILSVGELSERKNQKVVIDALAKMKAEGSIGNIVYLAVGKGDSQEIFEQLVKKNRLEDHIKLLGFRTDIDELCETVDCFVHLGVREEFGIAPLEAMAAGLPLISVIDGIKDYTENDVSGCCVNPLDVNTMVDAIKRMRDDKGFRIQCGANNLKAVKTFDIRNINEIMSEVYRGGYKHLLSVIIRQNKREEFGFDLDDFLIISVGELNKNKNHQVIIRSLQTLPQEVKYILVGKGNLEEQLKILAENLDVSKRIIFTGYRTDIKDLLYEADCFAFPSQREGLGIAALEGMSAGLPVIGHEIGGIRDFVIPEVTGWLCKEDEEYAEAIKKCYEELGYMSKACVEKAQEFDVEKVDLIMKGVYRKFE